MSAARPEAHVTVFRSVLGDAITAARPMSLEEVARVIRTAPPAPEKKKLALLKFARFGTKRSGLNALRHDENVVALTGCEGDYDAGVMTLEQAAEKLRAAGIHALLYPTPTSTPENPKWRVLAPYSRAYEGTTEELRKVHAHNVGTMNAVLGGVLAGESFNLSLTYYFGPLEGRPIPEVVILDGTPIDVCEGLPAPILREPKAKGAGKVGDDGKTEYDPRTDAELREAFAKRTARYESMKKLSARWAARGMAADDIEAALVALLGDNHINCDGVDLRQRARPLATSAVAKFGETRRPTYATEWPDGALHDDGDEEGQPEWPEPVDFLRELAAPAFTPDMVPAELGEYPFNYAKQTGIDSSICILAATCCAAAAIDDAFAIVADSATGWMQSPRLWGLHVAPSGSGKSPAQSAMLAPLHAIQRAVVRSWQQQVDASSGDDKPPPKPRIVLSDTTVEALSEALRDNPRGLLVANDEFESFLGSLDQYRRGGASRDRGEWLRTFDGGPHTVERVQRGSVYVPNYGVSLLTATTPTALTKLAGMLPEDGLLQRFLVVAARRQQDGEPVPLLEGMRLTYEDLLGRLYNLEPRAHGGKVPMMPDAREEFAQWRRKARAQQAAMDGLDPSLGAHLAKYPTFALRLALVFHMVTMKHGADPAEYPVQASTMRMAYRFLDRCRQHAAAIYLHLRGQSDAFAIARDVARAVLAKKWGRLERRELHKSSWAFRKAREHEQAAALTLLADLGWLATAEDGYRKPTPTRYYVNPRVHEMFAAIGEQERERRAAVRELIAVAAEERR